jgi:hypothetical protein
MTKTPWIVGAALATALVAAAGYAEAAPGSPPPPPQTRADLQARIAEHFKKLDANGDGYVTKAEFDAARTAMKAQAAERRKERRDKVFAALDANKDGVLSRQEFDTPPQHRHDGTDGAKAGGPQGPGPDSPGGPRDGRWRGHRGGPMMHGGMAMMMGPRGGWFDRADANKDGKVSLAEASAGPLAMFDKVDTNHDGTISPEERTAAREAMRAKWRERRGGESKPQG